MKKLPLAKLVLPVLMLLFSINADAANTVLPAITMTPNSDGSQTYTLSLQILALMTGLTLLPAVLLMMTSFTRIIIVFAILRQALGTSSTPSNQILLGMALFLSFFIMSPVLTKAYDTAVVPYMDDQITEVQMAEKMIIPFKEFMLQQTREDDIELFANMADSPPIATPDDTPFNILLPAFVTSELKTAFQIGFLIFIPFIVIDLTVASVLMSMGMMMLSPMIISLPFKLMLFVLVDGWALVMGTLAASFFTT